jgi:hypothetical protein
MINWILNNKEWIFSGIGLAVIGLLWKVCSFFYSKRSLHRLPESKPFCRTQPSLLQSRQLPNPITQKPVKFDATVVSAQSDAALYKSPQAPARRAPILCLSIDEILSQIRALPPLQQEDSFKSYIGTRIQYLGLINSISKGQNETANLELYRPESTAKVTFSIVISDCPELKHIQLATPIVAEGDLFSLSSYNQFKLDNVLLYPPPDTPIITPGITMNRTKAYTTLRKIRDNMGLGMNMRNAVELAMSSLFPELHRLTFSQRITQEEKRLTIDSLASLKDMRTDAIERQALDRAIDTFSAIPKER